MRLLLISDLHGNKEALDVILNEVKYDRIVCMGDLVDYGPDPLAIIDWIRSNKIPTIRGNHDNAVGSARRLRLRLQVQAPVRGHEGIHLEPDH